MGVTRPDCHDLGRGARADPTTASEISAFTEVPGGDEEIHPTAGTARIALSD